MALGTGRIWDDRCLNNKLITQIKDKVHVSPYTYWEYIQ